ncbi:hypothetical protein ACJQWK_08894 [Exserohilum turcicum]
MHRYASDFVHYGCIHRVAVPLTQPTIPLTWPHQALVPLQPPLLTTQPLHFRQHTPGQPVLPYDAHDLHKLLPNGCDAQPPGSSRRYPLSQGDWHAATQSSQVPLVYAVISLQTA